MRQLRNMADAIERKDVAAEAVVFALWSEDRYNPELFMWGKIPDMYSAVGRLADAQNYMLDSIRNAAAMEDDED